MSNVIVPPDIYERDRVVVRSEPLVAVTGRLERRQGTINVLAQRVEALSRPGRPVLGPAQPAEPGEAELRRLRAAAPVANSFGRGRR
jgi:error-prone DNA polymerase